MGLFSKSCKYAIRAVFYIACQSSIDKKIGIKEIAENIDSPEPFLAKILQKLVKDGIIKSSKGPNGGFYMEQQELELPIAHIIISLEGDEIFTGCAMGLRQCSESQPCPLHEDFKTIRSSLTNLLYNTSIGNFNHELSLGIFKLGLN